MTQTTWYHSNKHMQIKITHVMKNHSQYELNKYSGVPWKQHCLSKLTLSSEKPQALLLSLKAQKTQDDSWFHCKVVQKMPLSTLPGTVDNIGQYIEVKLTREKHCQDIAIKKREFCKFML